MCKPDHPLYLGHPPNSGPPTLPRAPTEFRTTHFTSGHPPNSGPPTLPPGTHRIPDHPLYLRAPTEFRTTHFTSGHPPNSGPPTLPPGTHRIPDHSRVNWMVLSNELGGGSGLSWVVRSKLGGTKLGGGDGARRVATGRLYDTLPPTFYPRKLTARHSTPRRFTPCINTVNLINLQEINGG